MAIVYITKEIPFCAHISNALGLDVVNLAILKGKKVSEIKNQRKT
jgi:hypothetical protein